MTMDWCDRIVRDAQTLNGTPHVHGTTIPVSSVLDHLAAHMDLQQVLASYPSLFEDDVRACLAWAAELSRREEAGASSSEAAADEVKQGTLMDPLLSMPNVGEHADFNRPSCP